MRIIYFLLVVTVVSAIQASFFGGRKASVNLVGAGDSGVSGVLILEQAVPNGPVLIRGQVQGLKRGHHGFHIHAKGQLGNECKDAGPHFNPFKKSHGDPSLTPFFLTRVQRHLGDLGNIYTRFDAYPTQVFKMDNLITLQEGKENSILGRAIVIHQGEDDLGKGGNAESLKTGNAGARVACGVISKH